MHVLEELLANAEGEADFSLEAGGRPALNVRLRGKAVTIELLNASIAMELAGEHMFSGRPVGSRTLERLKKAGLRVKVKYKVLEFDL